MPAIIFILVLIGLILAHEFGHFIAAKATGMRVDEFGIGLPPKILGWKPKKSDTEYTLNWLPFGGFVRIWGEDGVGQDASAIPVDTSRRFGNRPKWAQIITLCAGVCMNAIVAWLLLSFSFMSGLPMSVSQAPEGAFVEARGMTIISVMPDSPAARAGLHGGDVILSLSDGEKILENPQTPEEVSGFIAGEAGREMTLSYRRADKTENVPLTPVPGIVEGRAAIGISMDMIGKVRLGFFAALLYGIQSTGILMRDIAVGFGSLITEIVRGTANLSAVSGPVGIAGMFSASAEFGLAYVLSFVAFISANLAVLNLLPFPALDGGRILFVIIESVKRSPIKPIVANTLNTIGFAALLILMTLVTWQDVIKLFR
ncbi:MAG: RIP metalloprotease RseP [Candidatus Yonathbacteria bacterium]|nr:RIP metalloprotease RseP [Candidatus Yonathbacteria bacterium]